MFLPSRLCKGDEVHVAEISEDEKLYMEFEGMKLAECVVCGM